MGYNPTFEPLADWLANKQQTEMNKRHLIMAGLFIAGALAGVAFAGYRAANAAPVQP